MDSYAGDHQLWSLVVRNCEFTKPLHCAGVAGNYKALNHCIKHVLCHSVMQNFGWKKEKVDQIYVDLKNLC